MATITSAASGNFSSPATWVGGIVPGPLDNARANTGHNVTIDVNTTVIDIQAISTGRFIMGEGVTLTGNVIAPASTNTTLLIPVTTNCTIIGNMTTLTIAGSFIAEKTAAGVGGTLNIIGNVSGGSSTNMRGLLVSSTGIVNITGDVTAPTIAGVNNANAVVLNAICTLNIIGNVTLTAAVTNSSVSSAVTSSLNVTVNVTGNVRGASVAAIIVGGNNGVVNVNGNVIAPVGQNIGPSLSMTGANSVVTVTGDVYGGTYGNGITLTGLNSLCTVNGKIYAPNDNIVYTGVSSNANIVNRGLVITGDIYHGLLGALPYKANVVKVNHSTNGKTIYYDTAGVINTRASLTAVDFNIPLEEDVRQGIVYGDSTYTGTLAVPSPSNVRNGVPTDNTVGTADLTAQDFLDLLSTSPDPVAERLRNVSTVQSTGDQIASLS